MKNIVFKLILIQVLSLFFCAASFASESDNSKTKNIQFIYLHGTGNNSIESEATFFNKTNKLHSYMKPVFEGSLLIKEHFLKNGAYTIAEMSIPFYWGDKTRELVESLNTNLEYTQRKFSLHQAIRSKIIHVLHDAVWFSQEHSKHIVLDSLHSKVSNSVKGNDGFVLFGHSAGSLITFDYLKYRLPIFNLPEVFQYNNVDLTGINLNDHTQNTCLQAFLNSELARFDEDGQIKPAKELSDKSYLNERLKVLDVITPTTCIPDGKLRGVVTFGSPIAIFFSESMVEGREKRLVQKLVKYVYDNDIFWLHINHIDDAIGVALAQKSIDANIAALKSSGDTSKTGFIENNNNKHAGATVINAHMWYWKKPKSFAKLVVETYETGYRHWFGTPSPKK